MVHAIITGEVSVCSRSQWRSEDPFHMAVCERRMIIRVFLLPAHAPLILLF